MITDTRLLEVQMGREAELFLIAMIHIISLPYAVSKNAFKDLLDLVESSFEIAACCDELNAVPQ
jgi:hypothetical protein